jgi:hypothetical protein
MNSVIKYRFRVEVELDEEEHERAMEAAAQHIAEQVEKVWRADVAAQLVTTRSAYEQELSFERTPHGVTATVGRNDGLFSLGVRVEGGQRGPFDLKPGYLHGNPWKYGPRTDRGTIIFRKLGPRTIPIDTAWPNKHKQWMHPGIKARDIKARVMADFRSRIGPEAVQAYLDEVGA